MNFLAVASIVALSLISSASCDCTAPFVAFGDSCFYLSINDATWFQAKVDCMQIAGGQLVVLDTEDESNWVQSIIATHGEGRNHWIGATSVGLSEYVWDATSQAVSYGNWVDGNAPTTFDQAVYINGLTYYWYPYNYSYTARYMCEPIASC